MWATVDEKRAKVPDPQRVIDDVVEAVGCWPEHAASAGVEAQHVRIVSEELAATALAG